MMNSVTGKWISDGSEFITLRFGIDANQLFAEVPALLWFPNIQETRLYGETGHPRYTERVGNRGNGTIDYAHSFSSDQRVILPSARSQDDVIRAEIRFDDFADGLALHYFADFEGWSNAH